MKYICLNPIAEAGLAKLPENYERVENINEADAVLVRSAKMTEMAIPETVCAIARAGAGVNNIPVDACAEAGIVVFNTPGANANGVKELTILGMLLASRDAKGGMQWVEENKADEALSKTMEKAKAKFAGTELKGKTLAVIGLGAIGVLVANTAVALGMRVYGYDPFLSVEHALKMDSHVHLRKNLSDVLTVADYVTLHVPETPETVGMINEETLQEMNDGAVLLNFARDGLVNNKALAEALNLNKLRKYVTDVPNYEVAQLPNVIAFPHLGASTEESETNCAIMAAEELSDYLDNGNIKNSVNYPACSMGPARKPVRICVAHRNVPNIISTVTTVLGSVQANISDMVSKSRGNYSYAMFDLDHKLDPEVIEKVRALPDVLRVRVI